MIATTPNDLDRLDLHGIAAAAPLIPCKLRTPAPELVPKDMPLNERLCNHAKLTSLHWDCTTESLHLPTLTENGKWLYCSPDQAGINEAMVNIFANMPEALSRSSDFLHREVDLPHHNPLMYAQYATGYFKVASMQSIKLTGKSKIPFCFYLVPDSKSLAKECELASYDHKAEVLLGKAKENLSKF
jgi:hypothetical protein